jgi:hypothetical protein
MPVKTLGSVKVGMKGLVKPEPPVGGMYTAKVIVVDRVVDAASGTFGVRPSCPIRAPARRVEVQSRIQKE